MNRKINKENPDIKDIAPTTLELFGIDVPFYMQGTSLIGNYEGEKQNAKDYPKKIFISISKIRCWLLLVAFGLLMYKLKIS